MKIPSLPETPKHLTVEAAGWGQRITPQWELDTPALLLLESALESFDRMRQAQRKLRKEGTQIKDRFGQVKQHPAILTERDSKSLMLRQLKALDNLLIFPEVLLLNVSFSWVFLDHGPCPANTGIAPCNKKREKMKKEKDGRQKGLPMGVSHLLRTAASVAP